MTIDGAHYVKAASDLIEHFYGSKESMPVDCVITVSVHDAATKETQELLTISKVVDMDAAEEMYYALVDALTHPAQAVPSNVHVPTIEDLIESPDENGIAAIQIRSFQVEVNGPFEVHVSV